MTTLQALTDLSKAITAGNYNQAPNTLVQGGALQIENLAPVMQNLTYDNEHLKFQAAIGAKPVKSTLPQFDRQLSYGIFGGSAVFEGDVGSEETSDFVRIAIPMAFYATTRRVTVQATLVDTVDGVKADDRAASDATLKLAGDIEFDLMRGFDDFSNGGAFDGAPMAVPNLPNIHGLAYQIRQSDTQVNTRDLMFAEYGSDDSVVLSVGDTLRQDTVEDASVRSSLNFGNAKKLLVDPIVLSAYNKLTFGKERIILAGSAQNSTGGDLRKQFVSGGTVDVEMSHFLRGKARPARQRANGPTSPTFTSAANTGVGSNLLAGVYQVYVTSVNEIGESAGSAVTAITVATDGDGFTLTITPGSGTTRHFNVYASAPGGTAASAKFIGRQANSGATTTAFVNVGNKIQGSVTGLLVDYSTMDIAQLAPYSRLKMAQNDLSLPEAHFTFETLRVYKPRQNVVVSNLIGTV